MNAAEQVQIAANQIKIAKTLTLIAEEGTEKDLANIRLDLAYSQLAHAKTAEVLEKSTKLISELFTRVEKLEDILEEKSK